MPYRDEDDDIIEADYDRTTFDDPDEGVDEDDDLLDEDELEDVEDEEDLEDEDFDDDGDLPSQRERDEAEGFVDYLDREEDA